MKILLFGPRLWNSLWGPGQDLAKAYTREHDVIYIEPIVHSSKNKKSSLQVSGKNAKPENVRILSRKTRVKYGILYGLVLETKNGWAALAEDYDLLSTFLTLGGLASIIIAKLKRKKVVLIYADDYESLYPKLAGIFTKFIFTPVVTKLADHVVCTAHKLRADALRYNKNVTYIPNGVHLPTFKKVKGKKRRAFTIGFIGGFGEWVDFDMVLDVAGKLPEVKFLLVGAGERFEYVKKKSKKLRNVILTGNVPFKEIPEQLSKMDVCLIPFKINRLTDRVSPVKLFEYWAAGKPVISTRFHEARKTGENIILFADNSKELARRINQLESKSLRNRLGKKGLNKVREYDWDILGKKHLNIIKLI